MNPCDCPLSQPKSLALHTFNVAADLWDRRTLRSFARSIGCKVDRSRRFTVWSIVFTGLDCNASLRLCVACENSFQVLCLPPLQLIISIPLALIAALIEAGAVRLFAVLCLVHALGARGLPSLDARLLLR